MTFYGTLKDGIRKASKLELHTGTTEKHKYRGWKKSVRIYKNVASEKKISGSREVFGKKTLSSEKSRRTRTVLLEEQRAIASQRMNEYWQKKVGKIKEVWLDYQ